MKGLKLCLSLLLAVVVSVHCFSYIAAANAAVNACEDKSTGAIRILVSGTCNAGENPITLNLAGAQGPTGPQGPQGPAGVKGDKGLTGPMGLQGAVGAKGPTGPKGATGPQGVQGLQGAHGLQGPMGATGLTGPKGATGPQGVQGPQGPSGAQGAQGLRGAQGTQGPEGPRGPQGPAGLTWKGLWNNTTGYAINDVVGFNGSAYICLAANSNVQPDGNAVDWELLAKKGDQGAVGPQGLQGVTGPTGPQGLRGLAGLAGAQGAQGLQGPVGPTGPQGAVGNTGPKGDTGAAGSTGPTGLQGLRGLPGLSGGIKVYDNNNQFIGLLIDYLPGTVSNVSFFYVFVPGLNKVAVLKLSDDGNSFYMASHQMLYELNGCSGAAVNSGDSNSLFQGYNGIYYTGGSFIAVISSLSPSSTSITYKSYSNDGITCKDCVSDCVINSSDYSSGSKGVFYQSVEVPVADIPFTLPPAAPLHFQTD